MDGEYTDAGFGQVVASLLAVISQNRVPQGLSDDLAGMCWNFLSHIKKTKALEVHSYSRPSPSVARIWRRPKAHPNFEKKKIRLDFENWLAPVPVNQWENNSHEAANFVLVITFDRKQFEG